MFASILRRIRDNQRQRIAEAEKYHNELVRQHSEQWKRRTNDNPLDTSLFFYLKDKRAGELRGCVRDQLAQSFQGIGVTPEDLRDMAADLEAVKAEQ